MNEPQFDDPRSDSAPTRREKARSPGPSSGADSDPDSSVSYDDLFGTPALDSEDKQEESPPSPPPLDRPASEAHRTVYEAAFRVAYEHPDELMGALRAVRKGLQRGKKTAESGGDLR